MPEGSVSPDNTIHCSDECDEHDGGMDDDDDRCHVWRWWWLY